MGEALLRKHAGDRFEFHSAGTDPKGVNPLSIEALAEIGIDASGQERTVTREAFPPFFTSRSATE